MLISSSKTFGASLEGMEPRASPDLCHVTPYQELQYGAGSQHGISHDPCGLLNPTIPPEVRLQILEFGIG